MTIQNKKSPKKPSLDNANPFSEHLQNELTAIQKRWKDVKFYKVAISGNPLFRATRFEFKKKYKKNTFTSNVIISTSIQGKELQYGICDFRNESLQLFAEYVKRT